MTRFDADDPERRRKLFADAVAAHRKRASPFLTVEADLGAVDPDADVDPGRGGADGQAGDDGDPNPLDADPDPASIGTGNDPGDSDGRDDHDDRDDRGSQKSPPWVQYGDGTLNLDCTDEELDRLTTLLDRYPAVRIDDLTSPDGAEGTNVRATTRVDAGRLAGLIDDVFREAYDLPESYRAWVVAV